MSTLAVDNITDEVGTGSPAFTNGLAQSDIAGALNATGSAPIYACRAWVNFDGTDGTIRDSGNVSSITKNGTGNYTVNFATAMPDNQYSVTGSAMRGVDGLSVQLLLAPKNSTVYSDSYNTGSIQVLTSRTDNAASPLDSISANVSIFR